MKLKDTTSSGAGGCNGTDNFKGPSAMLLAPSYWFFTIEQKATIEQENRTSRHGFRADLAALIVGLEAAAMPAKCQERLTGHLEARVAKIWAPNELQVYL